MTRAMQQFLARRQFLAGGLYGLGGMSLATPLAKALQGLPDETPFPRSLVLVQLSGGNDGLSTIVPFADDGYAAARQTTRLLKGDVLPLDDYRGMHGNLKGLHRKYQEGNMAIIEGVGYEEMIRSHFRAMEVWHTGRRAGRLSGEGWVGQLAQAAWDSEDHPNLVVHLGGEVPYSVYSTHHPAAALQAPTVYKWFGKQQVELAYGMAAARADSEKPSEPKHVGRDKALAGLRSILDDAHDSSASIRKAAALYRERVEYPRNRLGGGLRDVAALIHGRLGTRVFSLKMEGFDTHAGQRGSHDSLMESLDTALSAFMDDLSNTPAGRDTLVLVFSEFGRRVTENGSRGTDHGKAGPMFVLGSSVKGGLYGKHPSLENLDDGDLASTTDFRSVYGAIIEHWFKTPHEAVLGKKYPLLPLFG
jgi:uncharacterized protein (DUF1501 family)